MTKITRQDLLEGLPDGFEIKPGVTVVFQMHPLIYSVQIRPTPVYDNIQIDGWALFSPDGKLLGIEQQGYHLNNHLMSINEKDREDFIKQVAVVRAGQGR